jgi:hypothetical protein
VTRAADKTTDPVPVERVVSLLRERLYGAISCLATHGRAPRGAEALRILQSSGQIVEAALLPVAVLAVAGFGVIRIYTAIWVAMWIFVAELGVIALLAVRRTQLPWWQKLFTVAGLVRVDVVVLGVKILAH